ncbi:glycosyltransferase [Cytobacillus firmus]|uniref:CgeB family protein n=1 Tax=Cytobacillus firmus TaxID=1399 RepID=UPI002161CBCE|nr:glycosyltransferase [Cytobacillus firmus]MCS0674054.1 glycosyltransferase [Cytobacillus firmus]
MKILLVTSGYKGIYDYFETWIQDELSNKHDIKFFDFEQELSSLQEIVHLFKPDLAFTLTGLRIPLAMLVWLKQQGIKTAVWLTEDPYYIDQTSDLIEYFDFVFTIDSAALEYYHKKGHKQVYHMPLAANPNIFRPMQVEDNYLSDICLVGYPYPDRVKFVQLLLQYTAFKVLLVGEWRSFARKFRRYQNIIIHEGWVAPSIAAKYYNGAKIILNTHRPPNQMHNKNKKGISGKSINNRTFEVASCAAFQLIDYKEDLPKHFSENEEIISFRSMEELLEKTNYYMKADKERKAIALKARERVLKEHTYQQRLEKMISIIESFG